MKVPLSWLKEFVEVTFDDAELADKLTMTGLEVESISKPGDDLAGIVVAEIVRVRPHPNADKLTVCEVHDGKQRLDVVCGAPNARDGAKVALAYAGMRLPDGTELQEAAIRGVRSTGMLCSERELGLGDDHSGIMILPDELLLGKPLAEALSLDDTVLNIAIAPNRPDCLSIIGVAREVAAITGKSLCEPAVKIEETGPPVEDYARVIVEDYDLCPRYTARVILDVKIGPSPSWMALRLQMCGIRAINNIVDITNYVLVEMGHPLHAFDRKRVAGQTIIVRRAKKGEKIVALDENEYSLKEDMLLIADPEKALALAGIMGGQDSGVDEKSSEVILESAYFSPSSIRRTSKNLGLMSESSYRFERGADPDIQVRAADRAAALMAEVSGGRVCRGLIDVLKNPYKPPKMKLRVDRANALLATSIEAEEMASIFEKLSIPVASRNTETIELQIPSFRVDLQREADLIEEVARIYGYENIGSEASRGRAISPEPNPLRRFERRTKILLTGLGFYEIICCNLLQEKLLQRMDNSVFDIGNTLRVKTDSVAGRNVLRPSLIPGVLDTVSRNLSRRRENIRFFELGKIHASGDKGNPSEKTSLCLAVAGMSDETGWRPQPREVDFFDLKGAVERYLIGLGAGDIEFRPGSMSLMYQGRTAQMLLGGTPIGIIGEIRKDILDAFEIDTPVFAAVLEGDTLVEYAALRMAFTKPSVYPGVKRDVAIVVDEDIPYGEIAAAIEGSGVDILESVRLFDIYRGKQVGIGKKSLAFSLQYRRHEATLTDEEVDKAHLSILEHLKKKLNCKIRED